MNGKVDLSTCQKLALVADCFLLIILIQDNLTIDKKEKIVKKINKGKVISMKSYKHLATFLFICFGAIFVIGLGPVLAQSKPDASKINPAQPAELRDGQHDFDWELGTWKVNISRLK